MSEAFDLVQLVVIEVEQSKAGKCGNVNSLKLIAGHSQDLYAGGPIQISLGKIGKFIEIYYSQHFVLSEFEAPQRTKVEAGQLRQQVEVTDNRDRIVTHIEAQKTNASYISKIYHHLARQTYSWDPSKSTADR